MYGKSLLRILMGKLVAIRVCPAPHCCALTSWNFEFESHIVSNPLSIVAWCFLRCLEGTTFSTRCLIFGLVVSRCWYKSFACSNVCALLSLHPYVYYNFYKGRMHFPCIGQENKRAVGRSKTAGHNEDMKGSCMEMEPSPPSNPYGIHL